MQLCKRDWMICTYYLLADRQSMKTMLENSLFTIVTTLKLKLSINSNLNIIPK